MMKLNDSKLDDEVKRF